MKKRKLKDTNPLQAIDIPVTTDNNTLPYAVEKRPGFIPAKPLPGKARAGTVEIAKSNIGP